MVQRVVWKAQSVLKSTELNLKFLFDTAASVGQGIKQRERAALIDKKLQLVISE